MMTAIRRTLRYTRYFLSAYSVVALGKGIN